ncbi:MAG: ion transporter, partial [Phycisphaeraceae bacterium]
MIATHLTKIVHSTWFQGSIIGLILLAAVVVGLETNRGLMAEYGHILKGLDAFIIGVFILEAIMKMGAHGRCPLRYFRDPWNCFDFTIVVLCLIPATGQFAAVIRLARVLRTLRLVSVVPRLQIIVSSLLKGLPSMGYVGILLLMLFY